KPRSPNRPAILLIGALLALGSGVGYGGVLDALDPSIKSPTHLVRTFAISALSVIPHIETGLERATRRRKRMALWVLLACAVVVADWAIHLLCGPLGVLWTGLPGRHETAFWARPKTNIH